jgi:hypothetical protein
VVEVKFSEWTADGKLRQPIYLGTRDDKDPHDVGREKQSVQKKKSAKPAPLADGSKSRARRRVYAEPTVLPPPDSKAASRSRKTSTRKPRSSAVAGLIGNLRKSRMGPEVGRSKSTG